MINIKHTCEQCDSQFTIKYDENLTADSPHFCAFCGEMMFDVEQTYDEEDDD
jgi:hypothetical protein